MTTNLSNQLILRMQELVHFSIKHVMTQLHMPRLTPYAALAVGSI